MAHPDVPAEQAHVDHAYERLEAMRASAESMLHDAFGERGGTFQALAERDIRVRTSLNRLEQLQIGGESLVFGRIDRQPPAGSDGPGEQYHIGRLAISDADQEPLVVDWRAPVVEPFYRATGAHPMGLARRRHLLTQGRTVVDLEDELFDREGSDAGAHLGLSGPQVLLAALERSRTGRMRDIVATVQAEQDAIIRAPLSGILIVQGGPGTGKTAVALHRAAYLLYTHRFPLERQGLLVVGPNPVFLRYIEHVLPSLGETGVELSTVAGLFDDARPRGSEPEAVARLKGDPRMAQLVAHAVADRQRPLARAAVVPYGRMQLRITRAMSAEVVAAAKRRPGSHNARRRIVENLLWRHLAGQIEGRTNAGAGGDDGIDDQGPTPQELGRSLRRLPEVVEVLDRIWPILRPAELLHDLFGARALLALAGREVLDDAELSLLRRERRATWEDVEWTEADIPLLDEARSLLGPPRRKPDPDAEIRAFGHIVVDEAQDLSPMQLRMLARRSLSGSMTVVGDIAQGTSGWAPRDWKEIIRHLPTRRGWQLVELTVNYRTPEEIVALAARVLAEVEPGMAPPAAVRSSGQPPRFIPAAGDVADAAARAVVGELQALGGEGEGIVGVIAPPSLAGAVADRVAGEGLPVGRGVLDDPISVLAVEQAKGLEFDSVVVVEPASLVDESPQGLRALYVALTRATRRLAVVHARPLPDCLTVEARA